MSSHEKMITHQAEKHSLIETCSFRSLEAYVLHLGHTAAYKKAANLTHGKSVLDVGCNTGYGTDILSRSAAKIVGVDVSSKAIEMASNLYLKGGTEFRVSNGNTLPFQESIFDVVTSFQVIEHVVDTKLFLVDIKRIVRNNGIVLFTTPNAALRLYPGQKPWNSFHVQEFLAEELKSLLQDYFAHVAILGLYAVEPLYSIQVQSFARTRDVNWSKPCSRGRKLVRKSTNLIRDIQKKIFKPVQSVRLKRMMKIYGADDFFYDTKDLSRALSLLAVCARNKDLLDHSRRTLLSP